MDQDGLITIDGSGLGMNQDGLREPMDQDEWIRIDGWIRTNEWMDQDWKRNWKTSFSHGNFFKFYIYEDVHNICSI